MKIAVKILRWGVALFFSSTILAVIIYSFVPVYVTPLMVLRCVEKGTFTIHHHWVPLEEMAPSMPVAVMASEDQRFLLHHGFDFDAIEKAAVHNRKNKGRKHGASTISQQTAKNVFLWPGRSWVRKGFEAYFTALIEILWTKHRIMEVYLNSIEMGEFIYGVDACAEYNFDGKTAAELTRSNCALIAATLPNPRYYSSRNPGPYMRKRQRQIEHEMRFIPSFPLQGQDYDPNTASGGVYSK